MQTTSVQIHLFDCIRLHIDICTVLFAEGNKSMRTWNWSQAKLRENWKNSYYGNNKNIGANCKWNCWSVWWYLPIHLICHPSCRHRIFRPSFVVTAMIGQPWWHFEPVASMPPIVPTIVLVMRSKWPNDELPVSKRSKSPKCKSYAEHGTNACYVAIQHLNVRWSCFLLFD